MKTLFDPPAAVTIQQVMAHPGYRRFAADMTASSRQVVPEGSPWKHMGLSDQEILEAYDVDRTGKPLSRASRDMYLLCVRHNEQRVLSWWARYGARYE